MTDRVSPQDEKKVEQNSSGTSAAVVKGTAIITLVIKVFGLCMAANEAFLVNPPRDPVILGVAAFMMAGATGIDSLVNAIIGSKQ